MATPTDPLFAQQWHLPMIGNIRKVWDDYTGAGVSVVVYDDGVETTHADLAANYNAGGHFRFNGITYAPTPQTGDDAHGTACAGLIAAVDNNGRGGSGVAHGARVTGVDYLNDLQNAYNWTTQTTSPLYDAVMRWAARFDIMSNSWGTTPSYAYELNLNISRNSSAVDAAHFAWVSANGRDGLGTIIVKAAGNESMNANGDGANVSRHTITVSATERNGFIADYSNYGSSILLTAPAAAVTTDLMGERGYNRSGSNDGDSLAQTDYTSTFSGTSAATPVVSGVVALMLDANARLGWRDVHSILTLSASHTGSAVGGSARGAEEGTWQTMGGNQWNGGGSIYHLSYGFGMVDAYAAVRMAEVWSRLAGPADTSANEVHLRQNYSGANVAIRDSDGRNSTAEAQIAFRVTQDIQIDSIHVTLDITHSYARDLVIFLRSPTGQQITLFNREGATPDPLDDFGASLFDFGLEWTFAAEAFRGMSSLGTWRVMVHDRASGDTGIITDARLDFYGSANSVNDVYTFTDDFAMLRNLQAGRRVIDDTNGGVDWLNFAAVSGNLSVNMAAGGAIRIGGEFMARLARGQADFERLQAGDGADKIVGNAKANVIYGGRGNDRISGGSGADRLFGEAGNDTLTGGAANDSLSGGRGSDVFVFGRNFGRDRITDWTDNADTLRLDDAIWGGGMTVSRVLSTFGEVVNNGVVLDFGDTMVLTLQGVRNLTSLADDITIF
ncbi:S8 family serine peptidase [Tabrizicola sp.]|uniref:S8 family serine peptidase n=1 Tax=Tabrizicola sp. TaxID=2005166 RepID=UPI003D28DB71